MSRFLIRKLSDIFDKMNKHDTISTDGFRFSWCTPENAGEIDRLVELFIRNAQTNYISHSEVIEGRSATLDQWPADLRSRMRREFSSALSKPCNDQENCSRLCICRSGEDIAGIAIVEFHPSTRVVVIADILVDSPFRGRGAGESFMAWIEEESMKWGGRYIFLESGYSNVPAHRFFERLGYRPSSVVMHKKITDK